MRPCPVCTEPLQYVAALDLEAELVDVENEDGELVGEEVKVDSRNYREFWRCKGCGFTCPD